MVDINDLNRRREGRELLLLSITDVFPSANGFLKSAIIQRVAIALLTVMFVSIQLLFSSSNINILPFLSLSFEGPAKWIFLGHIFYMILIVAKVTTAIFYNHFEVNMLKSIPGVGSILAWVNFIGMNVGGARITLSISRHVYKTIIGYSY
jgi:hypothetical protein